MCYWCKTNDKSALIRPPDFKGKESSCWASRRQKKIVPLLFFQNQKIHTDLVVALDDKGIRAFVIPSGSKGK